MRVPPDIDAWAPWTPLEVSARFAVIAYPWAVVGGWALDLWHGCITRAHGDIEIAILRPDLATFRVAMSDHDLYMAHDGEIAYLPPDADPPGEVTQFWCLDRASQKWRLDIMIERGTPRRWVYKRDKRLTRPRAEAVGFGYRSLPYLNPACVLLFKAKYMRDKDEVDFKRAVPLLARRDREWLQGALSVSHPDHPWTATLGV